MVKIAVISDVHGKWNKIKIPECDILISCGDYSFRGEPHMVKEFHEWLNKQEAGYIISVMGNHEQWVEKNFQEAKSIAVEACPAVHFIEEGLVEIEGVKLWCSAWTPTFGFNWAYNADRGEEIKRHWDKIPKDTDILISHGPPYGILDELKYVDGTPKGVFVGCRDLLEVIQKFKIPIHVFGHIHEHGSEQVHLNGTSFYNASICDEQYQAVNAPHIIEYIK
jgi:Icc-related predicted phosphoesterase